MKKLLFLVVASMFSLNAFAMNFGKVDVQKVLLTIKEGQKIHEMLKKVYEEKQKLLAKDEEKFKSVQVDFEKKGAMMKPETKAAKEQELQEMYMKLQQKSMDFNKEMQDLEQKHKKPVLAKVKDVIDQVSKEQNMDLTFEAAGSAVVYAKALKDLTDDVVKAYDKKFPTK